MNFYEHQRRNRRLTVLLIVVFVLLFAAMGGGVDAAVAGYGFGAAAFPYITVGAVVLSLAITGLGYRRGGDWVMRSLLAEPLRPRIPSPASSTTSPPRWRWPPDCRARGCSSFPIPPPTRSPPGVRPPTPRSR